MNGEAELNAAYSAGQKLLENSFVVLHLQRSSNCHGGQPYLYCPAPVPGRNHGLGDDCVGDPGAWIW